VTTVLASPPIPTRFIERTAEDRPGIGDDPTENLVA